jgi:hypothetical protein
MRVGCEALVGSTEIARSAVSIRRSKLRVLMVLT